MQGRQGGLEVFSRTHLLVCNCNDGENKILADDDEAKHADHKEDGHEDHQSRPGILPPASESHNSRLKAGKNEAKQAKGQAQSSG